VIGWVGDKKFLWNINEDTTRKASVLKTEKEKGE
jgi:hypothetical protein